jgi:hypothetical protein
MSNEAVTHSNNFAPIDELAERVYDKIFSSEFNFETVATRDPNVSTGIDPITGHAVITRFYGSNQNYVKLYLYSKDDVWFIEHEQQDPDLDDYSHGALYFRRTNTCRELTPGGQVTCTRRYGNITSAHGGLNDLKPPETVTATMDQTKYDVWFKNLGILDAGIYFPNKDAIDLRQTDRRRHLGSRLVKRIFG